MPETSRAVLALGSNLGDREATIRQAVRDLDALADVTVIAASSIIETPALKPDGIDMDAPAYLNAVVIVETSIDPFALLAAVNGIERANGRVRDVRWGDRTLDIDIVEMSGIRIDTAELTIPHPRAGDRAFVLAPWLQVDPDATLPGRGRVRDLAAALLRATAKTATAKTAAAKTATADIASPYPAGPLL